MIEISNLTATSVNEKFLRKVAQIVLDNEKNKTADLSIVLVSQGRMKELNKKYRGENRATDILAFPESEVVFEKFIENLGEIIICLKEVNKNAKKYKTTQEVELSRVLIHGLLHLFGDDHEKSEAAAKRMREKEEYYFSKFYVKN